MIPLEVERHSQVSRDIRHTYLEYKYMFVMIKAYLHPPFIQLFSVRHGTVSPALSVE
jgi:hypothetical protein